VYFVYDPDGEMGAMGWGKVRQTSIADVMVPS
jgi:hypothetical protein